MISPRLARRIAQIHKWLGLIVFAQLLVWTATGLFLRVDAHDRGARRKSRASAGACDAGGPAQVKFTSTDALKAVAEDQPYDVTLKTLAGTPVYEVRGEIGTFLVSAETGERIVVDEELARSIARATWVSDAPIEKVEELESAPRESSVKGDVWALHFAGDGKPMLYVSAVNGRVSAPRTDLWRTYDFLYGLHMMDYSDHENYTTPWMVALAALALSTTLFGVALLVHRFTRGLIRKDAE